MYQWQISYSWAINYPNITIFKIFDPPIYAQATNDWLPNEHPSDPVLVTVGCYSSLAWSYKLLQWLHIKWLAFLTKGFSACWMAYIVYITFYLIAVSQCKGGLVGVNTKLCWWKCLAVVGIILFKGYINRNLIVFIRPRYTKGRVWPPKIQLLEYAIPTPPPSPKKTYMLRC